MTQATFKRDNFAWMSFALLGYYSFCISALGPLMPFLRSDLGLSYTVGAMHFSMMSAAVLLMGVCGNKLMTYFGRNRLLWLGGFISALAIALISTGQNAFLTIGGASLLGFGGCAMTQAIYTSMAERYGEGRAPAIAEANISASLFASCAPLAIGFFVHNQIGWRATYFVALVAFAIIAFGSRHVQINTTRLASNVRDQFRLPASYWAYWFVILLSVSGEWSIVFWSADYLEKIGGFTRADAAISVSVFLIAMLCGRVLGSRLVRDISLKTILFWASFLSCGGFLIFWLATTSTMHLIGLATAGLGVANMYPMTLSAAIGTAGHHAGVATSRLYLATGSANLITPIVVGRLADQFGIYRAYTLIAILFTVGVLMVLIANKLSEKRPNVSSGS
jgi:MFS family permease